MLNSKLIAISGHMGSGKDTVAGILANKLPGSQSYAFADHLKQIATDVFGCKISEIYGDDKEQEFLNYIPLSETHLKDIYVWVKERNDIYSTAQLTKSLFLYDS